MILSANASAVGSPISPAGRRSSWDPRRPSSSATAGVLLWAVSGPLFQFSDTWQLVINTGTTVLTFLAVFLIQHSQNRDGRAIQLKLDELNRSTKDARNRLIDLEHCSDEEMERLQKEFSREQTRRRSAAKADAQ